jgi:hypothetical protein
VTAVVKLPGQLSSSGGLATLWAVTRVNPEQAPKGSCECRPAWDAGKAVAPEAGETAERLVTRRGSGDGTQREGASQHGRPIAERESLTRNRSLGGGPRWESEGPIVPWKPGNAGGGKGPWFWVLRKEQRRGDWR